MTIVREPDQTSQGPDPHAQIALLRHALTNAAAAIAGLLTEHPTANDARATARAWLRTWEAYKLAIREQTAGRPAAIAGGVR